MDRDSTRDAVGVDRRGPLSGQEVRMFPLGGQRLGAEFDDAELDRSLAQRRIDAVKALWPCQIRLSHTLSSSGLVVAARGLTPQGTGAVLREGP